MEQLPPAGLIGSLVSLLFPKKLTSEVRISHLANGQVEVVPVYLIGGQEVPSELVRGAGSQQILGYRVEVDRAAYQVHQQTHGKRARLSRRQAGQFLGKVRATGVRIASEDGSIQVRVTEVKPEVKLELDEHDRLRVETELVTPDGVIVAKPKGIHEITEEEGWIAVGPDIFRAVTTGTDLDRVLSLAGGNRTLVGDEVPEFIERLDLFESKTAGIEKNARLQPLSVFGGSGENQAKVDGDGSSIDVATALVTRTPSGKAVEHSPEELKRIALKGGGYARGPEGWAKVSTQLIDKHGEACDELKNRIGNLTRIRGSDIPRALETLTEAAGREGANSTPWSVYFSKEVKDAHRLVDTPTQAGFRLNIVESDGRSLLELDPIYNHERFQVSHQDAAEAIASGTEWVRRRNAWIKVDADKIAKVEGGIKLAGLERGEQGLLFPASQRERIIEIFSILGTIRHSDSYSAFLAKLLDFDRIEDVPLPGTLRPAISLRPYQKHGFNWLAFLHRFGLNGILADDMGLGKTIQTLTAIQRAHEMARNPYPSLVICPTSVVNNWQTEANRFFENFEVVRYTGAVNSRLLRLLEVRKTIDRVDRTKVPLVVTSFDIARLDVRLLNQIPWLYVVVDEGHNIKNPDAERTKAIKTLNGQHKLALTGTPIQNRLEELWSLFDFVMPGYLGKRSQFQQQYSRNGNVNWEEVHHGKTPLKDRVHPFILRRLKENVARDLPPKEIIDLRVELKPRQVAAYKQVLASAECKRVVDEADSKGAGKMKVLILAVYTKLRTICNHPCLATADASRGDASPADSGKLECLEELIKEIVDGEHRALLFCQSTEMLNVIENCFEQWKVTCCRLDGSTPPNRRGQLVDTFNRDTTLTCFLISTKAGGTGLNLTGADTVIFYDHDWNPANDRQAQDRAYRIGQKKPVTVYRLITKGTIEERIIERQLQKQTLADQIIGADEEGFKDLTRDELVALFRLEESSD